jgi:beta-alanine degradation protein BauB
MNSSQVWPDAHTQLPQNLREEFLANRGDEGTRLVSETEKVRVWHLNLAPGGRIGFRTHVLDYFRLR